MIKILAAIWFGLTFSVANASNYFPFVQTHTFQMEPYLKNSQGYALFVASSQFNGAEVVRVRAPLGFLFPDVKKEERFLTQYSNNMWYISDHERVASAMGGPLPSGVYEYSISDSQKTRTFSFHHQNSFLKPALDIRIKDRGDSLLFTWKADSQANTFWVLIFPSDTTNILKYLRPVSSVMHKPTWYALSKNKLKPGSYKVAIRSNRIIARGNFWAFDSEAWSISEKSFSVK